MLLRTDYQPGNAAPGSASAVAIGEGFEVYTPKGGPFKYPVPRALETPEIKQIVQQYVQAAKNAIDAGFDGVEVCGLSSSRLVTSQVGAQHSCQICQMLTSVSAESI